jgi:hypothetical protein
MNCLLINLSATKLPSTNDLDNTTVENPPFPITWMN